MTDIGTLTHGQFTHYLNQMFTIDPGDAPLIETELVEVKSIGVQDTGRGGRQQFSVLFRGPMEPILPQGIYTLSNGELGEIQLFLVAIGPDARGFLYEAVFS